MENQQVKSSSILLLFDKNVGERRFLKDNLQVLTCRSILPYRTYIVQTEREFHTDVVFGTPSKHCAGAGICKVMMRIPERVSIQCPYAPAWLSYRSGKVCFRFQKSFTSSSRLKERWQGPYFIVEEPFRLPEFLVRKWKVPTAWVGPGKYRIFQNKEDWYLFLELQ